ncbi:tetratricopeptide repeat protein [Lactobacillus delbrueckii]|uniref:tetratricopeptide repeat protein n=1 Tax=Lactobacillus delbrueckii TaxID=1584 RepID=UPI0022E876AE|nr:tetratricopeptide repeat protein [Lactobacillus delbrueckii]
MAFSDKDEIVEMDKIGATWLDRGAEAYRQGDYELALQCYKKAADYGNSQAMCNLGYIYAFGRVGEADQEQAFYYFTQASLAGNPNAFYKLGDAFRFGNFVKRNDEIAFQYYSMAESVLQEGDEDMIAEIDYRLALCYARGWGTDQRWDLALKYINEAQLYAYRNKQHGEYNWQKTSQRINKLHDEIVSEMFS